MRLHSTRYKAMEVLGKALVPCGDWWVGNRDEVVDSVHRLRRDKPDQEFQLGVEKVFIEVIT